MTFHEDRLDSGGDSLQQAVPFFTMVLGCVRTAIEGQDGIPRVPRLKYIILLRFEEADLIRNTKDLRYELFIG